MKDSILVLGGSGFIGQHFINLALKKTIGSFGAFDLVSLACSK